MKFCFIKAKKIVVMKKVFLSILIAFSVYSCKESTDASQNNGDSTDVQDLQNQIAQLKLDQQLKDSAITESLAFFNEIQANLESIGLKKDEIRIRSNNPELSSDDKRWILEEIRHINFLREENAKKVQNLSGQLKKSGLRIKELEGMINRLVNDIQLKDNQIAELQGEMNRMDQEYSKLFDAYQVVNLKVDDLTEEMNTVYYTYGTAKELEGNQVVEQKNGFIGIGKKTKLLDNFNENYFEKIDRTKKKEIFVEGLKIRLITDHPSNSYTIVQDGVNSKIKITKPSEFWKVSRYLVVLVE